MLELFKLIDASPYNQTQLCEKAGIQRNSLNYWRRGHNGYLPNIQAVANLLGYELVLRRKQ